MKHITISRNRLAVALAVHPRTLARAIAGKPVKTSFIHDVQLSIADMLDVLHMKRSFLSEILEGSDRAISTSVACEELGLAHEEFMGLQKIGLITPAAKWSRNSKRFSANEIERAVPGIVRQLAKPVGKRSVSKVGRELAA